MLVDFKLTIEDDEYLARLKIYSRPQFDVMHMFYCLKTETYEAIASALGIPVGTVKSRLSRARSKIVKWRAEVALKDTL